MFLHRQPELKSTLTGTVPVAVARDLVNLGGTWNHPMSNLRIRPPERLQARWNGTVELIERCQGPAAHLGMAGSLIVPQSCSHLLIEHRQ